MVLDKSTVHRQVPNEPVATPPLAVWDHVWFLVWGVLAIVVALACARFAFAPLVPPMKAALAYTSGDIGWLGAVHLVGYAIGGTTAGPLSRRLGRKPSITLALAAIGLTLALTATTSWYPLHLLLRAASGVASAWAVVLSMSLVLDHAPPGRAGLFIGVVNAGSGLGIALTGILLPPVLVFPDGWRWAWVALGVFSVFVCLGYAAGIRDRSRLLQPQTIQPGVWQRMLTNPALLLVLAAWAVFGFAYAATSTFFVAFLREVHALSSEQAALVWMLVGLSAAPGPLLAGTLRDAVGSVRMLVVLHLLVGGALLLLLMSALGPVMVVASVLFGASFGGVIAVVVVYVRELSPPEDVTYVIGATAIIGCIGQIAGPAVSGLVAEATGSLTGSFLLSAVMCFLSIPLIGLANWSRRKPSG